jgi:hypothetical protein
MGWGMLWLFVALKIPLLTLCWLVWWAIKQEPLPDEDAAPGGDGGARDPRRAPYRHPHPKLPRLPRRGPHGDQALPAPPRARPPVDARARSGTR